MDIKKLMKQLPSGWAEDAEMMDEAQLRNVIVQSENNLRVAKQEAEENQALVDAKENYKLMVGPFRDATKAQNAKIQYALHLLEQKGKI